MNKKNMPEIFWQLQSGECINSSDILKTSDGFWLIYKSLSDILSEKGILDFPDSDGKRLICSRFYDDWFLYAVPNEENYVYSLLKLREQEHDAKDDSPADGDTPGVTISFVSFDCRFLMACLGDPTDENRKKLDAEIDRAVAYRGQHHHKALKRYFINPQSNGAYLVTEVYAKYIASLAKDGCLAVPEHYKEIVRQSLRDKRSKKLARLPRFVDELNQAAGRVVCDNESIYFESREELTEYEIAAILATHTGNTSVFSFAAEVEYHARFLTPLARLKIPFVGKSIYDSAIRADMTVGDTECQGPAPFYQSGSKIVKRQYELHSGKYISERKK